MPVQLEWDNPQKTILRAALSEPHTASDLFTQHTPDNEALDGRGIGVIVTLPRSLSLSPHAMLCARRVVDSMDTPFRMYVLVTENVVYRSFLHLLHRVIPESQAVIRGACTIDEARALILRHLDQALPTAFSERTG